MYLGHFCKQKQLYQAAHDNPEKKPNPILKIETKHNGNKFKAFTSHQLFPSSSSSSSSPSPTAPPLRSSIISITIQQSFFSFFPLKPHTGRSKRGVMNTLYVTPPSQSLSVTSLKPKKSSVRVRKNNKTKPPKTRTRINYLACR